MAGMRVGYTISNKTIIGYMLSIKPIYEINAFGINEILIAKYTLFFTFFLIGLIDDYIDLRPLTKIFLYSAVSLLCLQFENNVQITKIYTILQSSQG